MASQDHISKLVNEYLVELHKAVNRRCFGDVLSECLMEFTSDIDSEGLFKPETAKTAIGHAKFHKIVININDWTPNGEQERIVSMIHQCTHQCLWEYGGVKVGEHYHKKVFVEKMYDFGILCLDKTSPSIFKANFTDIKPQTGRNITHRIINFDHIGDIQEYMYSNHITLPVTTIATEKKEPTRVKWECPKCGEIAMKARNKYKSIICGECKVDYVRKA